MTVRNLPQRELEKYWAELGASNPGIQPLVGINTGARFDATEPAMTTTRPQPRSPRGPQMS